VIESGRLHPITAIRQAWLQLSVFVWLAWDHRDIFDDVTDKFGVRGPVASVLTFVALVSLIVYVSWRKTAFTMTSAYLDYHYGLMRQVHRRINVDQIRTVDVEHPLFGRPFGVRALVFSTAAGPTKLAYLGPHAAAKLHDAVVTQTGATSTRASSEGVVARVTATRLALSILLDVEELLGLIIGGAMSFIPFIVSGHVFTLGLALPWLRTTWRATGKKFPKYHGWTVREVAAGYRVEYGLFNKEQFTWQRDRICSITLHQPLLWRSRDWVKVTGGFVGREGGDGNGPEDPDGLLLIPVTTRAQAEKMLVRIYGPEVLKLIDEPVRAPRRARWCTLWRRGCALSHSRDFVIGWRGLFLKQTATIAPLARVLGVNVLQGPWQRVHQLAHVRLSLPGGDDVLAAHRDIHEAARVASMIRASTVNSVLTGTPIARRFVEKIIKESR
jgi:putative membrane protein